MEAQVKEYKAQRYMPGVFFFIFYVVYIIWEIYQKNYSHLIGLFIVGLLVFGYIFGFRATKYLITRKSLTIHYLIRKDKEIFMNDIETITDPLPKMTKILINAHALEMFDINGRRMVIEPEDQVGFVRDLLAANKRISCQVKAYNESYKNVKKRDRKRR